MTRYVVTTPEPRWTGEVASVAFAHGTGITPEDPPARVLNYFRRKGYGVTPVEQVDKPAETPKAEPVAPADGDPMPRRSASKTDWQAYAISHGVPAEEAEALTRDQLAERFTEGADL